MSARVSDGGEKNAPPLVPVSSVPFSPTLAYPSRAPLVLRRSLLVLYLHSTTVIPKHTKIYKHIARYKHLTYRGYHSFLRLFKI